MRPRIVEPVVAPADAAADSARLGACFERRVSEFAGAARRVRGADDHEAIHDLRVATRRLVAVLRVWRDLVPARARRDAGRSLRRLRRRIGRARETEVHIALLEERLPSRGPSGGSPAAGELDRLRARLVRRRRSAARRVSPRRLKRLLRRIEAAGAGLGTRPPGRAGALEVERRLAGRAGKALRGAAQHPDDPSLHEARVAVKKWRYALECLEETVPGAAPQAVRPLRRIQGELGEARDRALLRGRLERAARRAGPAAADPELERLVEALERERDRAVQRFQRLAAAFIAPPPAPPPPAADLDAPARPSAPPPVAPVAAADPGGPPPDPEAPEGPADPRDQRWDRMATWLERARRRG